MESDPIDPLVGASPAICLGEPSENQPIQRVNVHVFPLLALINQIPSVFGMFKTELDKIRYVVPVVVVKDIRPVVA
jgi:hypothetical protein